MLLVQLRLKRCVNLGYLLSTAKFVLHPAHKDFRSQIRKRNQVALGTLKTDRAVGTRCIGAILGIYGVVSGEHVTVRDLALKVGDVLG